MLLALRAGVSTATIARVYGGRRSHDGTRERIVAAAIATGVAVPPPQPPKDRDHGG